MYLAKQGLVKNETECNLIKNILKKQFMIEWCLANNKDFLFMYFILTSCSCKHHYIFVFLVISLIRIYLHGSFGETTWMDAKMFLGQWELSTLYCTEGTTLILDTFSTGRKIPDCKRRKAGQCLSDNIMSVLSCFSFKKPTTVFC